ncbi:MAG: hypothetical protein ABI411_14285 [Tahibacter sp.]
MRTLLVLFFLLAASPVGAQCVGSNFTPTGALFPTQLSFEPAQPLAGQAVTAIIGPPIQEDIDYLVTRNAGTILVTGSLNLFGGLPPPPHLNHVPLGAFAPGSYAINLQFTYNDAGTTCTPFSGTLVVGGASANSVPTLGWPMRIALLACLVAMVGWGKQRGRRDGEEPI